MGEQLIPPFDVEHVWSARGHTVRVAKPLAESRNESSSLDRVESRNRRMRTRMYGAVGRGKLRGFPYTD
jgi:hypothetical protein